MRVRAAVLVMTGAVLTLAGAPTAFAQDGVFFDPESPTAKEYAIPLDVARRAGSGKKASPNGAPGAQVPLFGEGVGEGFATGSDSGASRGGETASETTGQASGNGFSPRRRGKSGRGSRPGAADRALRSTRPGTPREAGLGGGLALFGGGAGVLLLLGAAIGYALRRRHPWGG